jgi:hypothetical protein
MMRYTRMLFLLGIALLLPACATKLQQKKPIHDAPIGSKIATPFEQLSSKTMGKTIFEDKGKFILIEGSQCAQRESGFEVATLLQWIEMPNYVDKATVILNGWQLRYLQGDREVNAMRVDITHSKLVKNVGASLLVFEAQGKIEDQHRKDAYEFCVFYTGFGYHSAWFDSSIEGDYNGIEATLLQNKNQGPVATLESKGNKGTLKINDALAIIPRGFDFQFDNTFECELRLLPCKWGDRIDHRLLQVAYNLAQTGIAPNLDGSPHWATQTIFKDGDSRTHAHRIKTRTAMIRGRSIKLRSDFLALNPRSGKMNTCRQNTEGVVRTQTFRIDDLPYDYAIPMLTAWDLSYECEHQRVQRAGIWIHDVYFDPDSNSLEYKVSSILRDQDGIPGFNAAHRVTVLGLNRLESPAQRQSPEVKIKIRGRD